MRPSLNVSSFRTPSGGTAAVPSAPTLVMETPRANPAHRKLRQQAAQKLTDRVANLCTALNFFAFWGLTSWAYASSLCAFVTTTLASNTYSLRRGRDETNARALASATCLTGWLITALVVNSVEFILGVFLLGKTGVDYATAVTQAGVANASGGERWIAYCMTFSWVISGVNLGISATILVLQLQLRLLLGLLSSDEVAATAAFVEQEHQAQTVANLQRSSIYNNAHLTNSAVLDEIEDNAAGVAISASAAAANHHHNPRRQSAAAHHHAHHSAAHQQRRSSNTGNAGSSNADAASVVVVENGVASSTSRGVGATRASLPPVPVAEAPGVKERLSLSVANSAGTAVGAGDEASSPVSPRALRVVAMSSGPTPAVTPNTSFRVD